MGYIPGAMKRRLLIEGLAFLLLLAPVAAPQEGADRLEEDVLVLGKRLGEARSGVIEIRVEARNGSFVGGLKSRDFSINGGRVRVDAVREIRFAPAIIYMMDYTTSLEFPRNRKGRGREVVEDPHLYYADLMKEVSRRFPGGTAALSFLLSGGIANGTFIVNEQETAWIGSAGLAYLLEAAPDRLFPSRTTPVSPHMDKHLYEGMEWVSRRFGDLGAPAYRRFLVLFSDGYGGDPALSMNVVPGSWKAEYRTYGEAGGSLSTTPSGESVRREAGLSLALSERGIHPIFVFRPLDIRHRVFLWGRGEMWAYGARVLQERTRELAERHEGGAVHWKVLKPGKAVRAITDEIESQLDQYWIAWSTPPEEKRGETFLEIETGAGGRARAVPDRLGERDLLGRDLYHVRHLGPLWRMPWTMLAVLYEERAERIERMGVLLEARLDGISWRAEAHCPYVFGMAGREQPDLAGEMVLAWRRATGVYARDDERLRAETLAFLDGKEQVDLCAWTDFMEKRGPQADPVERADPGGLRDR